MIFGILGSIALGVAGLFFGASIGMKAGYLQCGADIERKAKKPMHWPQQKHFKGVTADGKKFVFCPIGQIVSWHPGDHDHDFCAWCKEYFTEVKDGHS